MPAERNTREKANPMDIILISDGEDDFPPIEDAFLGYLEKKKSKYAKEQKQRRREKRHDDLLKQLARAEKTNEKLASALASFKEFASCGICLAFMEDPIAIMCGHVFCRSCITLEAEFQVTRSGSIAHQDPDVYGCPTCRHPVPKTTPFFKIHGLGCMVESLPSED